MYNILSWITHISSMFRKKSLLILILWFLNKLFSIITTFTLVMFLSYSNDCLIIQFSWKSNHFKLFIIIFYCQWPHSFSSTVERSTRVCQAHQWRESWHDTQAGGLETILCLISLASCRWKSHPGHCRKFNKSVDEPPHPHDIDSHCCWWLYFLLCNFVLVISSY